MNIFFLGYGQNAACRELVDAHVRKMGLESVQMLSTAHHVLDGQPRKHAQGTRTTYFLDTKFGHSIYKATHVNHPCSIWARANDKNYNWLVNYAKAIFQEYKYRFGKAHASEKILDRLLAEPEKISYDTKMSQPPLCMPDIYKSNDVIASYQKYYFYDKILENNLGLWTGRDVPRWVLFYNELLKEEQCRIMITDAMRAVTNSKNSRQSQTGNHLVTNLVQPVEKYLKWSK